jgi:lysozyme
MTPDGRQKLKALLVSHEEYRQFPYTDTTGNLTIGIGRCLTTRGISTIEAFQLLDDDVLYFASKLDHNLPFYSDLSEPRQIALIDMCFNLGINGLLDFKETIQALNDKDYEKAAQCMLDSKWATQVGERATCLANIIKTGTL